MFATYCHRQTHKGIEQTPFNTFKVQYVLYLQMRNKLATARTLTLQPADTVSMAYSQQHADK